MSRRKEPFEGFVPYIVAYAEDADLRVEALCSRNARKWTISLTKLDGGVYTLLWHTKNRAEAIAKFRWFRDLLDSDRVDWLSDGGWLSERSLARSAAWNERSRAKRRRAGCACGCGCGCGSSACSAERTK